ncbi:MAG: hypothetical protein ABI767_03540 [Rhodanobacter sp.]
MNLTPFLAPKLTTLTFAQAWKLICKAAPEGTLTSRDRLAVELCAHLLVELRSEGANMHPAKLGRLAVSLGTLGLTPADASRVAAAPPPNPDANEFSDFD